MHPGRLFRPLRTSVLAFYVGYNTSPCRLSTSKGPCVLRPRSTSSDRQTRSPLQASKVVDWVRSPSEGVYQCRGRTGSAASRNERGYCTRIPRGVAVYPNRSVVRSQKLECTVRVPG